TSKTTTVKPSKVAARTVRWERGEGTGSDQRMLGRPARVVLVFRAAMATPSAPRRARGRNGVQPLAPWLVAKLTAEQKWSAAAQQVASRPASCCARGLRCRREP